MSSIGIFFFPINDDQGESSMRIEKFRAGRILYENREIQRRICSIIRLLVAVRDSKQSMPNDRTTQLLGPPLCYIKMKETEHWNKLTLYLRAVSSANGLTTQLSGCPLPHI